MFQKALSGLITKSIAGLILSKKVQPETVLSCKRFSLPHKVVSLIIESVGWMQDKNDLIAQKTYNLYISESMEGSNSTWNFDKNEKIYSVIFKLPNYVSRLRSPRYQRKSRKNPQSQGYPLIPGMKIPNRRVIYLFGATAAGFRDIPKIPGIEIYFFDSGFFRGFHISIPRILKF